MHYNVNMEHNKIYSTRELFRKAFNEEFHFTNIIGFNRDKLIVPAKKHRTSDISNDLISKLYNDFSLCDDNGNALPLSIPLDEHINTMCKMMYVINRDEAYEIGYECSCAVVFTLYSVCKHTFRLANDRNELDLHPDLDFRSLGRQAKRGMPKRKIQV